MRLGIAAAASGLVRTGLLMGAVSGIAGCGGRGEIGLMPPETKATGPVAEMLVATSRQTAPAPELFSNERDYSVHFANFQIAIPPNRKAGEVKFPKGKPDPENDFLVTSHQILDGERSFIRALNTASWATRSASSRPLTSSRLLSARRTTQPMPRRSAKRPCARRCVLCP